jgi:hypothetical protein
VLRHLDAFRKERVIFLYHTLPAGAVGLAALAAALAVPAPVMLAKAALVMSLHGIYSLSFLELWSLAQGCYSVSILGYLEGARRSGVPADMAELEKIGADKKKNRLDNLQRLALIRRKGQGFGLSWSGRVVATGLHVLMCLANLKEAG